jgi:6-pyruvoyltetrahydropterin/6-carboxytetrahydropterin synthase
MPFEISTEAGFSAAHFIAGYQGDCSKLHGHNWRVRVTLRATERKASGLTYDFRDLRAIMAEAVKQLDHTVLNDLPQFNGRNPTAETIAEWLYGQICRRIDDQSVTVGRVEVWESPLNCAAFLRE